MIEQALIQWLMGSAASTTWEDRQELRSRFPAAPAWRQASAKGGGGVRSPTVPDHEAVEGNTRSDGELLSQSDDGAPKQPKRPMRPNPRFFGPEWGK